MQETNSEPSKMNRRKFLKAGTISALGALYGLCLGGYSQARNADTFDSYIPVELKTDERIIVVRVPKYNPLKVFPGNCSGYVRRAAWDLFRKEFSASNAWDRRFKDTLVGRVCDNEGLETAEQKGVLKPGMIIGVYYPHSLHLNSENMYEEKVPYTHNMIYLGRNKENGMVFAEQFGTRTRVRTLEEFAEDNLEPREIIDSK